MHAPSRRSGHAPRGHVSGEGSRRTWASAGSSQVLRHCGGRCLRHPLAVLLLLASRQPERVRSVLLILRPLVVDASRSLQTPFHSARAASALGNFPPSLHPACCPRRARDHAELTNPPSHFTPVTHRPAPFQDSSAASDPRAPRSYRAQSNRSGTPGGHVEQPAACAAHRAA
jgi:hypothetical protein